MNPLALAIVSGGLVGFAVAVLVGHLLPAHVDLAEAIGRVTPTRHPGRTGAPEGSAPPSDATERLGTWAARALPPALWVRTPHRELALLQVPVARFYGEKLLFVLVGLAMPPAISACAAVGGLTVPLGRVSEVVSGG